MQDMIVVGSIVLLQVQRSSLKVGATGQRVYDPGPLESVPRLELSAGGVIGCHDDERTIDVHHRDHAQSKQRQGANGLSLGFTAHYDAMRNRLGPHMIDGIAGENIVIETDRRITELDLAVGVLIAGASGPVRLVDLVPAEPCLEFSRFALRRGPQSSADELLTETLRFLRHGTRGFYARVEGEPAMIALGDVVYGVG